LPFRLQGLGKPRSRPLSPTDLLRSQIAGNIESRETIAELGKVKREVQSNKLELARRKEFGKELNRRELLRQALERAVAGASAVR